MLNILTFKVNNAYHFMENDTPEVAVDTQETTEETATDSEEVTTEAEEVEQDKPKETPQQKKSRLLRQLKRVQRELGEEPDEPITKTTKKSGDFDYGQKAFLKSSGINGSEEFAFVKTWADRTGDDLDTIVEDDIFQAKLEKFRSNKQTKVAIPPTGRRGSQAPSDSTEYWLSKPFSEVPKEMRQKVLNERLKRESNRTV